MYKILTSILLRMLLTCMLITSCNNLSRDQPEPEIRMGDANHILVNHHDTTLHSRYHEAQTLDLDIDSDGINDLQIGYEIWGSPGLGQHPRSTIGCLHDAIQLAGVYTFDTTFLNRGIWVEDEPGSQVEVWEYFNYVCHRIDQADSILSVKPAFHMKTFERDEKLRLNDSFLADTLTLYEDYFAYPPVSWESGDTMYHKSEVYGNDCCDLPMDETHFIGIKMTEGPRLGWIRLGVFGYYKILVLESAIQLVY